MQEILKKLAEVENGLDELIRTADHTSDEGRSKMIKQSQTFYSQRRKIKETIDKQQAKLGGLLGEVLLEVRSLAKTGSQEQILALLHAVGDLPRQMFDDQGFEWNTLRQGFQDYQQCYSTPHDYVGDLDEIRSSD